MRNLKLVIPDAAMSTQHCNISLTREAHNGRRNTTHLKCNGCYDIPICLPLCRTTILTESVFLSHMISRSLWRLVQQLQYTTMLVVFPEYHINCVQPFKCKNINQATGVHPTMPFFSRIVFIWYHIHRIELALRPNISSSSETASFQYFKLRPQRMWKLEMKTEIMWVCEVFCFWRTALQVHVVQTIYTHMETRIFRRSYRELTSVWQ